MYQPVQFRVGDTHILHAFIRAHPLGLLISANDDGPIADAVPFLLDAEAGEKGRLRAHVARANPHWPLLRTKGRALVVFQAAGHYISPGWYPSKAETGKVVPTWNYVMVQVRGHVKGHEENQWLMRQVEDLTRGHEEGRSEPWQVSDAPPDYIGAQMHGIVGFEIEIEEMSGKFKLSQNRTAQDQRAVVAALASDDGQGEALAALMRSHGIGA
jgi:transcriptional regulator